ncbi:MULTISPECIES: 1-acyl-sn-glycerol-3-phosphate acyltransferase [Actinomadura]|uniref:1-acyl-sn-glycerol-3-phosphate acyltransferase n=1 Tax=Actinomadura litoris TaxID=2678616 RepID=A0A7K1KX63_9ACTN|nr:MULTISPECIES: lysophospholipid acyltransferase family protein [Actinomadura]MBT2211627.1 1-acyl-sn-glycerol-3-phosphate acyltransferase [Actinomadura sp. NEAU-AAG7]MUN36546.1 1-acyl-sn-glycerol-3-phosphate acyltransferase [Actinomadura litoris]
MKGAVVITAFWRRACWRAAFGLAGGLEVTGPVPDGPCVIVANHSSHADTVALLAALPARRRPVVAAAADYWFAGRFRALVCRTAVAGFPVRRSRGGFDDLASAAAPLARGRCVIVFPEGTRSRDGEVGAFRTGAARLADLAGVPLVPVGLTGTRDLLGVHGRLRRTRVRVGFGAPTHDLEAARRAVQELTARAQRRPGTRT